MNAALDALCYIQEQTSYEDDYKGKFGYEYHDCGNGRFFLTFPAVLQSFGVKNRNGRKYDLNNVWHCIQTDEYIQEMLKHNSWMGEIDHPAPEIAGQELTVQRICNPNMERTSHYIRSPRIEGNLLTANIQTDSSTQAGMNMAIKIVDGKIVPCFSARVLGSKAPGSDVVIVKKLATYDWVLFPSHDVAVARINQPLMESVENKFEKETGIKIVYFKDLAKMAAGNSEETKLLCEAFQLTEEDIIGVTETGNSVVLAENSNIYVQPITSEQIRKRTQDSLRDWINK